MPESDGKRPVDASLKAIDRAENGAGNAAVYSVKTSRRGSTESQGEGTVRLQTRRPGVVNGVGCRPGHLVASAKAYLSAVEQAHSKIERVAAQG